EPPLSVLAELRSYLRVLDDLQIPYVLGGSLASSVLGISRNTRDADIAVEPFPGKEERLATSFGSNCYLSLAAIREALQQRSSFNIINTCTGFKVDVFIRKDDPFELSAMARRMRVALPDKPDEPLFLYTPEDLILFKLRWYRLGEETSDQQWEDVRGLLKVQQGRLDQGYLDQWAQTLHLADLLARARCETGI